MPTQESPQTDLEELAAAEHHRRPRRQRGQDVELGAGQHDRLIVDEHLTARDVDRQRPERSRRRSRRGAVASALAGDATVRGRRSMARIRATSSRGLNGLVT